MSTLTEDEALAKRCLDTLEKVTAVVTKDYPFKFKATGLTIEYPILVNVLPAEHWKSIGKPLK